MVYIVRDEKAIEVPVTLGKELGSYVEIKSGLMNGDKVIENVDDKITNGVKVNIK